MARFTLFIGLCLLFAGPLHALELHSPDIHAGKRISDTQVFNGFGCQGRNVSPALSWSDAPADTKSFAITAYDPDAPTGSGWWHWVVFNIPPSVTGLKAGAGDPASGSMPVGAVQSRTDFGKPGYGGPCPPQGHGIHHYRFTLYALDTPSLPLDANAPAAMVGYYLKQHALDSATITGVYSR